MDKKIQNLAWSVLPKEFKEEVKKMYCTSGHCAAEYTLLQQLFGVHNLNSDADEEEILMVNRKKVQEIYKISKDIVFNEDYGTKMYSIHLQIIHVLEFLFDFKYLPDTSSEPKHDRNFKLGDIVRFKYSDNCYSNPQEIKDIRINKDNIEYQIGTIWAKEKFLELYTAPKFKIGDIVYNEYDCPNNVSTITKVFSNSWGYTYCLNYQLDRIHENHLRSASPEEKIVINSDNLSKKALTKALINLENASLTLRKALDNFHG